MLNSPPPSSDFEPTGRLRAADRIRQIARELFYRQGIRAVGVDEIVARAGVTKPSLYRNFKSKDALTAEVLADCEREFWSRFETAIGAHPGDVRAQILQFFKNLTERSRAEDYRGCGLTNAAVEYPDPCAARTVAVTHKAALRRRLFDLASELGVADPQGLGDGLLLLIEGAFVSSQLFGPGGPSGAAAEAAERLIDAHLTSSPGRGV